MAVIRPSPGNNERSVVLFAARSFQCPLLYRTQAPATWTSIKSTTGHYLGYLRPHSFSIRSISSRMECKRPFIVDPLGGRHQDQPRFSALPLGEQGIHSLFKASAAGRKLPSEVNFFSAVRNLLQLDRSRDILGNAVICPVRPQLSRLK
jgi:hypothetical protein